MTINMMNQFLDGHRIDYTDTHDSAPRPSRMAADGPERMFMQTVMLNVNGSPAMAVIPASHALREETLADILEAESMRPAEAAELSELFPDCAADAIPPFGMLHGMPVFASEALALSPRLAFYAGSRSRVVEIPYADYFRLVVPILAPISAEPDAQQPRHRSARLPEKELCLQ